MTTILQRLARWATDLQVDAIPEAVAWRARLQHLHVASAARAVRDRPVALAIKKAASPRGVAADVTGGSLPRRDAVRLHAALSGWLEHDDYLFLGHTGHGAVSASWAWSRRHTVDDLVTATVAANEVAGRIGAAALLGPSNGQAWAAVHAAASTTAAGLLAGLDAQGLAHALAISLAMPHQVPWATLLGGGHGKALVTATPAVQGIDAVDMAMAGHEGPLDLLDSRDGLLSAIAWVPLRNAFSGLGEAWLTGTLAFKSMPGCAYVLPPLEAVGEILRRHVKAADKRLRADQVERIEVAVGAPGWALEHLVADRGGYDPASIPFSVRRSIGVLVVAHEVGARVLEPAWLAENQEAVDGIARRVEVRHDWEQTIALAAHFVETAAPLLAGLTVAELREVGQRARSAGFGGLPRPGASELLAILRARPDALFEAVRHASGDLDQARLDEWQFRFGCEVRLHTTRGGSWPERRSIPEGSPGWAWDDTVRQVLEQRGAPDGAARALFQADGTHDAEGWTRALLAG